MISRRASAFALFIAAFCVAALVAACGQAAASGSTTSASANNSSGASTTGSGTRVDTSGPNGICALLTKDEVSQVLGKTATTVTLDKDRAHCDYDAGNLHVTLTLIDSSDAVSFMKVARTANSEDMSGIGDEAFYAFGMGLVFRKGSIAWGVGAVDETFSTPADILKAMEKSLALLLVGRV